MKEFRETYQTEQRPPDGGFDVKCGQTTYKVKVYFDHNGHMTAEDRLKRIIQEEALKEKSRK